MSNCRNCGNKLDFITSICFYDICDKCREKKRNAEERIRNKQRQLEEKIEKAKEILDENTNYETFKEPLGKKTTNDEEQEFIFTNSELFGESEEYYLGDYYFQGFKEEELLDLIIKYQFDIKKVKIFLEEKIKKEIKENRIKGELDKIANREERRLEREEAEKIYYGKAKTKRQSFSEDEKDSILAKFGNKCSICSKDEGLHIHHKDMNPSNNQLDNLIVLCSVCHKKIHMKVR